ncbi:MAG: hypothetical protein ACR2QT_01390 [Woeseiaceae bacterium]
MTKRHWRELVEIVAVVSVVASMLLVAAEVRQSNRIASVQAELQIAEQHNALNIQRASDPNVAKLFPKLAAPEAHLTTATEASQIRGIASHHMYVLRSVHNAHKKGLLSSEARDIYVLDLARTMKEWPGIRPHLVAIYDSLGAEKGVEVYTPIAKHIAAQTAPESE